MTQSPSPSVELVSQASRFKEDVDDSKMKLQTQMASSATLPTTEMTLPAKVPHTRRINKSKTCYSFLQHQQHQQQQQQQGDIELATAIGQDLLLEVKKMQVLLQEKTNALTSLALEKADALQEVDQLTSQLKQRSDTIECRKEQLWTLEIEKQEQTQIVSNLKQQLKRVLAEQSRMEDQDNKLKQELEQLKQQQVVWQETEEQAKQDKLDLAITRRRFAALQRQVSSNKVMVDASRVSFAGGSNYATCDTARFSLPPNPQLNFSHLALSFPTTLSSSVSHPVSIAKNVRHQQQQQQDEMITMNAELRASLTTANDTIQTLQRSLIDEQNKRAEMEILWREAQEVIENEHGGTSSSSTTTTTSPRTAYQADDLLDSFTTNIDKTIGIELPAPPSKRAMSKETRVKRQKCFSLGYELSLARPGGTSPCFSTGDGYLGNNDVRTVLPNVAKQWCSEILEPHTNLDNTPALCGNPSEIRFSADHDFAQQKHHYGESINDLQAGLQCHVGEPSLSGSPPSQQSGVVADDNAKSNNYGDTSNGCNPHATCHHIHFGSGDFGENSDSRLYIRALTKTMIGDWMWKYTRRVAGKGISEHKHKRFFWLHPYSKTLYWSTQEPGVDGHFMIESFMVINDGLKTSFYLQSSNRSLKFQCTNDSAHQEWLLSLKHLLIDTPPMDLSANHYTKNKAKQHQVDYRRLGRLLKTHPPTQSIRYSSSQPDALSSNCASRRFHPTSSVSFPSIKRNHVPVKLAY